MNKRWLKLIGMLLILLMAVLLIGACTSTPEATEAPPLKTEEVVEVPETEEAVETAEAEDPTAEPEPVSKYSEAPEFAELVASGDLPNVEERLGSDPLVIEVDTVGKYGGNWRMGMMGGFDFPLFMRNHAYEPLVRWDLNYQGVIPNLAASWDVNEDATEFVFYLREGIKWSDGKPFTAADIDFYYNVIRKDEGLGFPPSSVMMTGKGPGTMEMVDDYTIKFTFPASHSLFLKNLATTSELAPYGVQAEYAKKFMPQYVGEDQFNKEMEAAGFTAYLDYFQSSVDRAFFGTGLPPEYSNVERPSLFAWIIDSPQTGNATQVTFKRNPYYWKVDQSGQQLPYITTLTADVFSDPQAMLLKAANGEIDMQMRHFTSLENKPLLFDNMEKGDYHFVPLYGTGANNLVPQLNLTHKDPAKRELFQNKDFRIGLSHAIDRQAIIDTLLLGLGSPYQVAVTEGSPLYNEQLATQYLEFNVDLANEYLDKVIPDKDSDGMRMLSDGSPLTIIMESYAAFKGQGDGANMVASMWTAVGVKTESKPGDRSLVTARQFGLDMDCLFFGMDGGLNPIMDAYAYVPHGTGTYWGGAWGNWYLGTGGELAEEPTGDMLRVFQLYDEIKSTADETAQMEIMKEILQINADNFWVIGIAQSNEAYGLVKNNFMNVPESMIASWTFPNPAPYNVGTFFFDD